MAHLFQSDDDFIEWTKDHSTGVVLNVRRNPSASYVILHKASCGCLLSQRYFPGALTERSYRKVGADTEADLLGWIKSHVADDAQFSRRCSRCGA